MSEKGHYVIYGLALGIAVFTSFYLAAISHYWETSPDSASYVILARDLAAGRGFAHVQGHAPVTSIIWSVPIALFPDSYALLNGLAKLFILLAIALAYVLLRREVGHPQSLLIVLMCLGSIGLFHESTQLLSEPFYMFFSMLALVLLESPRTADRSWWRELVGVVAVVLASLTRVVGLTLVLAILLFELGALAGGRRRLRPGLLAMMLVPLLAAALWEMLLTRTGVTSNFESSYLRAMPWVEGSPNLSPGELVTRFLERSQGALGIGSLLTNKPFDTSSAIVRALEIGATVLFVLGLALVLARRSTISALYVLFYVPVVTVHVVLGAETPTRFLIPILPLLFHYTFEGFRALAALAERHRPSAVTLLRVAALVYVAAYLDNGLRFITARLPEEHSSPFGDYPIRYSRNYDLQRLALWVRDHAGPDDVYASLHTHMFGVMTGRPGYELRFSVGLTPDGLVSSLERAHVRYVMADHLHGLIQTYLLPAIRARPDRFHLVSELPDASLYEVDRKL